MFASLLRNLRDLPSALTPSAVLSGLLVIVIGYASSLVIVFQAAANASLTPAQTSSWVLAITVGAGVSSVVMSLWFRQPVTSAWSTPGAALLVTSLAGYPFSEAVGAYLLAGVAVAALGFSGLFGRVMALIPTPIVLGMLAGILVRFGINAFNAIPQAPLVVIPMIGVYFVLRRRGFRAPAAVTLIVGLILAALTGTVHLEAFTLALAAPQLTLPTFSVASVLGLALPLFTLALTGQNAPGQAVLRNAGYDAPIDKALIVTGIVSALIAPFGGHGVTLAAITAALVTGSEAHPDREKRYAAGVATGCWYIVTGVFGAAIVALFAGLPPALIAATAGLGLVSAILSSLSGAMAEPDGREGALAAFLCTAANFSLLGIGAPFWGLVFGLAVDAIMRAGRSTTR
ncbi:MAG: benzoate/H(+) symporter BenE family transporter [bacterium]|nr:benzoate/H(+) symporter BenE family transporter [bacterium]